MSGNGYASSEVLVDTEWVANHLDDPAVRIVESDEDVALYDEGHLPGAVKADWRTDFQDPTVRDYVAPEKFALLCGRLGIGNDTTIVFYGDKSNWWAAYAYWTFKLYGHRSAKLMDGGRQKWQAEGRPMDRKVMVYPPTIYHTGGKSPNIRALLVDVLEHMGGRNSPALPGGRAIVDVRSPEEYRGELLHMADYPQEGALRAGHIPGARNVPWEEAANPDGTFKSPDELRRIYASQGVTEDKNVIVYCRIGERAAHSWFVLHELLGYPRVRNYDGAWTEWGNTVRVPIER